MRDNTLDNVIINKNSYRAINKELDKEVIHISNEIKDFFSKNPRLSEKSKYYLIMQNNRFIYHTKKIL